MIVKYGWPGVNKQSKMSSEQKAATEQPAAVLGKRLAAEDEVNLSDLSEDELDAALLPNKPGAAKSSAPATSPAAESESESDEDPAERP